MSDFKTDKVKWYEPPKPKRIKIHKSNTELVDGDVYVVDGEFMVRVGNAMKAQMDPKWKKLMRKIFNL